MLFHPYHNASQVTSYRSFIFHSFSRCQLDVCFVIILIKFLCTYVWKLASKVHINKSRYSPQSRSNRNVFRSRLNCPISTCGWHNSTGKLCHSHEPAIEELLSPRRVLVCGTFTRVSTSADHSWRRPAFKTSWQSSNKVYIDLYSAYTLTNL